MHPGTANCVAENSSFGVAYIVPESRVSLRLATPIIEQAIHHPFSWPFRVPRHKRTQRFVSSILRHTIRRHMPVEDCLEDSLVVFTDAEAKLTR
jgi:hypothetical protein